MPNTAVINQKGSHPLDKIFCNDDDIQSRAILSSILSITCTIPIIQIANNSTIRDLNPSLLQKYCEGLKNK